MFSLLLAFPLFLALLTVWLMNQWRPLQLHAGSRISSLDGLRGYLAFGVFLHHSTLWFFYLHNGEWNFPAPSWLQQLGEVSVTLFFMITGFLFTTKLRRAAPKKIDWVQLYTSRVMRIVPLWLVIKLLVVITALLIKRLDLDSDNPSHLAATASTGLMTAGVTWTLYYEWLFYFTLPWFALLLRKRPSVSWLLCSTLLIVLLGFHRVLSIYSLAFVGGMLSAWLFSLPHLRSFACSAKGSLTAAALLLWVLFAFETAYDVVPCLLLTLAFMLIASGANLFGILNTRLSRVFGEITFSIYLLHGFVLFLTFRFLIGLPLASTFTLQAHWLVISAITPVLIALSYLCFQYLESPAMRATPKIVVQIKTFLMRINIKQLRT